MTTIPTRKCTSEPQTRLLEAVWRSGGSIGCGVRNCSLRHLAERPAPCDSFLMLKNISRKTLCFCVAHFLGSALAHTEGEVSGISKRNTQAADRSTAWTWTDKTIPEVWTSHVFTLLLYFWESVRGPKVQHVREKEGEKGHWKQNCMPYLCTLSLLFNSSCCHLRKSLLF